MHVTLYDMSSLSLHIFVLLEMTHRCIGTRAKLTSIQWFQPWLDEAAINVIAYDA